MLNVVELMELREGEAFLEMDRTVGHGLTGYCVPAYGRDMISVQKNRYCRSTCARSSVRSSSRLFQRDRPFPVQDTLIKINKLDLKPGGDALLFIKVHMCNYAADQQGLPAT
jgi:hypothetical protein